MNAREEVLGRVRRALGTTDRPAPAPRDYRGAGEAPWAFDVTVSTLVDRLVDYRAGVTSAAAPEVADVVAEILRARSVRRIVVPAGFPGDWLPSGVAVVPDEPALTSAALDDVDGVLTTSAVAIAETGTIVLDAGPGQGRRALTLVPDLHVVVVREDDVVRGVPEALARLDATRPLTWISGPSATSDIELNRVEGVHGPRRLEVVVVRSTGH